jgi:epoxyqueuosine reductase QueG
MGKLEESVKEIAKENGAVLVGIASKERLADSPPSGNPEYILTSARSLISIAVTMDKNNLRDFLGKKDWLTHGDERQLMARTIYLIGDKISAFLRENGHEAVVVDVNNDYRPEEGAGNVTEMTEFLPDFAHRYAAVAAGLARIGWSGNVLNPEYGALLELGTVLTSAKLEEDPLLAENPCDNCKMCTLVCPVEMISKRESIKVTIAGITEEIGARKPVTCCFIGCSGYQSLSPDRKWSNYSPYRLDDSLPENKAALDQLNIRLLKADPMLSLEDNSFSDYRKAVFDENWHMGTVCGNCRAVCWKEHSAREENMRLVINSGVVVLSPNGQHVVGDGEIVEIQTPYIVKVAVLKKDYEAAQTGKDSAEVVEGYTPMDTEVLRHVFKSGSKGQ